jgi:urease accessory protein
MSEHASNSEPQKRYRFCTANGVHDMMVNEKAGKHVLIEAAIANIYDQPGSECIVDIDWLDLTWLECHNRAGRKQTRAGQEVSILLRLKQSLRHGDLLLQPAIGSAIVVNLLPAEVITVRPGNTTEWCSVAYELGNLHVPIEMSSTEILIPRDGAVEALLERLAIPFELNLRRFQPNFWPEFVSLSKNFRVIKS